MSDSFEPRILAFLCNWCAYAGADLAGVSRFQYPPNLRHIRTMCSGRVDPLYIIEGLKNGFDSVSVGKVQLPLSLPATGPRTMGRPGITSTLCPRR